MPPDIRHVFVLMQENQSFDRIFGWWDDIAKPLDVPAPGTQVEVEFLEEYDGWLSKGEGDQVVGLRVSGGGSPRQMHMQHHALEHVMREGFVRDAGARPNYAARETWMPRQPEVQLEYLRDFHLQWGKTFERKGLAEAARSVGLAVLAQTVRHVDIESVSVYAELARRYAVCERWFSTRLSFTIPNRYAFLHDSHALGGAPWTIFQALDRAGIDWGVFTDRAPLEPLFGPLWVTGDMVDPARSHPIEGSGLEQGLEQYLELWEGEPGKPHFGWIESRHAGSRSRRSNDLRHADLRNGQEVVREVYNQLRRSTLWPHTLLVVCYDEHGGWYDHVVPDLAPWGRGKAVADVRWTDLYGGRVPGLLVSPWIKPEPFHGAVDATAITALLHTLWHLPRRPGGLSTHHQGDPFGGAWRAAPDLEEPAAIPSVWGPSGKPRPASDEAAWVHTLGRPLTADERVVAEAFGSDGVNLDEMILKHVGGVG